METMSNDFALRFLEVYEKYPVIWDASNVDHKNRKRVLEAWNQIKNDLSVDIAVDDLKKKKESLMTTYRSQKKKITESKKFGTAEEEYKPTWFAFKSMDKFLKKIYLQEKTVARKRKQSVDITIEKSIRQATHALETMCRKKCRSESERDECTVYGELVAARLKDLNHKTRKIVINKIDNMIFSAEMEEYDRMQSPSSHSSEHGSD